MSRTALVLDVDGVLYDFVTALRNVVAVENSRRHQDLPDATKWEFYEDWGLSEEAFRSAYRLGVRRHNLCDMVDPMDGSVAVLQKVVASGCHIVIASDCGLDPVRPLAEQQRTTWLSRHSVPHHAKVFTSAKDAVVTTLLSEGYSRVIAVDDNEAQVHSMLDAGADARLLLRPYNSASLLHSSGASLSTLAELPGIL